MAFTRIPTGSRSNIPLNPSTDTAFRRPPPQMVLFDTTPHSVTCTITTGLPLQPQPPGFNSPFSFAWCPSFFAFRWEIHPIIRGKCRWWRIFAKKAAICINSGTKFHWVRVRGGEQAMLFYSCTAIHKPIQMRKSEGDGKQIVCTAPTWFSVPFHLKSQALFINTSRDDGFSPSTFDSFPPDTGTELKLNSSCPGRDRLIA